MTVTIDGRPFVAAPLIVPDCEEIRCLIANVSYGDLHLAAFDEAEHPRVPHGVGGGRFIKKALSSLKPGDKFEHPTLGTMERLGQGGASRADGRLTVRALATGKRVHMHPAREVHVAAPKQVALKVRKPKAVKGKSLGAELRKQIGTPEQYEAKVNKHIGQIVDVAEMNGGQPTRGILSKDPTFGHRLTTATHVLERQYQGREGRGWQTHTMGLPSDLEAQKAKLAKSTIMGGTHVENVGKPTYSALRIRKLGSWPDGEEKPKYNIEHERSQPVEIHKMHSVKPAGGERIHNPKAANTYMMTDEPKNLAGYTSAKRAINYPRPAEGYFPTSGDEPHELVKNSYRANYGVHTRGDQVLATGTRAEMQKMQRERNAADTHIRVAGGLTEVTFVSPIDGSIVKRQLTASELEKFNKLVEKSPEAVVADARKGFYRHQAAGEMIKPAKLGKLAPGTTYFNEHGQAVGVRGVEKKGGIEVHEPKNSYGNTLKARPAAASDVVHVKAGKQTSLLPRMVGHVSVTYNGGSHGLRDNAGQVHAEGLTHPQAVEQLRRMNDAYDKGERDPARAAALPSDPNVDTSHAGKRVYDRSDGSKVKTVESIERNAKIGPGGDWTDVVNFTDGTWAYPSMTEPVSDTGSPAKRVPGQIGPHAPQEPARMTQNMQGLHMPGGEPTTLGLRRGDRVHHPDHGGGIVQRVGPEPYTRDHGVNIKWDHGTGVNAESEWSLGDKKFEKLRYTGSGDTGSPERHQYRVGDRVMIDGTRPGTVTKAGVYVSSSMHNRQTGYSVRPDDASRSHPHAESRLSPMPEHVPGVHGPTHQELQSSVGPYILRREANGIPAGTPVHVVSANPGESIRVEAAGGRHAYTGGADSLAYMNTGVGGTMVEQGRHGGIEHATHISGGVPDTHSPTGGYPIQAYMDKLQRGLPRGHRVQWYPAMGGDGRVDFAVTAPDGHTARSASIKELWRHFNARDSAGSGAVNRSLRRPRALARR